MDLPSRGPQQADARHRVARSIDRARDGLSTRYVIRTGGAPVGTIGLAHLDGTSPDVFYALLPAGRGAGIATRSVVALADWALSHGAESVRVRTMVGNGASEAVARRAGFTFTEELVDEFDGARLRAWTRLA
nr:GNAT family N-acetyltransferase [Cellulomonas sp. PhB150]